MGTKTVQSFAARRDRPGLGCELADREAQEAARILGLRLQFVNADTEPDIAVAFAALVHARVDALVVVTDPLFNSRPHQLAALAARYALPTIYPYREFAAAGGLISYGGNLTEPWRLSYRPACRRWRLGGQAAASVYSRSRRGGDRCGVRHR